VIDAASKKSVITNDNTRAKRKQNSENNPQPTTSSTSQ